MGIVRSVDYLVSSVHRLGIGNGTVELF